MKYPSNRLALILAFLAAEPSLRLASDVVQTNLPPVKALLNKVVERGKTEEQNDGGFLQHYTFSRIKLNQEWNSEGKLKKRERKVSQHVPPKRPPIPIFARQNAVASGPQTDGPSKPLDRKDFPVDAEMLNRFQFTVIGRELLNGRSALVLDFKPAKNLTVRSYKDHFINKAAGRAWVDEKEFVVARADVHLTEGVGIVGGLAGAVKVFRYHFDRDRTSDGFWYAKDLKWHLEVREFLVNKTLEHEEQRLDPKKVR